MDSVLVTNVYVIGGYTTGVTYLQQR